MINVLIIRIINPADHPMIVSLTIVDAMVNNNNATGKTYTKNFLTENTLDLMIYTIGIQTARILRSTNCRFIRLANIV
jgi:hypothetical protein